MKTQAYYEKLKNVLYEQLSGALGNEVQIGWKIMPGQTLAILCRKRTGALMVDINLRAVELCKTAESLCSRILPRIIALRAHPMQRPVSYLQGLACLEDLYSLEKHNRVVLSGLPPQNAFKSRKKHVFTAADLYGAVCGGELAYLMHIPEVCYCGEYLPQSTLLRALAQTAWLIEHGCSHALVEFAAEAGTLCTLPALLDRCSADADAFWRGVSFRLMAVSACEAPGRPAEEFLRHCSAQWRQAVTDLWKMIPEGGHPIEKETLETAQKMLIKLDKVSWSGPANRSGGSLHFL